MKRVICVSPGYVESHRVWKTFFVSNTSYASDDEALNSLARDLWNIREDDAATQYYRKCCRKAREDSSNNYCSQCGTLLKPKEPDVEELADFVIEILSADADSLGDVLEDWWPWNTMDELLEIPKEQWVFLEDDYAETQLAKRMIAVKQGVSYEEIDE